MTAAVRIDPDGSTHHLDDRYVLVHAQAAWRERDVFTLTNPVFDPDTFVGIVEDYSFNARPLNIKGWVLYGRSPLFGPMFVGRDDGRPISRYVLSWLDQDWPQLIGTRELHALIEMSHAVWFDPAAIDQLKQEASRREH